MPWSKASATSCAPPTAPGHDLKAVNPNAKREENTRRPEELLDIIEAKGKEVGEALATLRELTGKKA